ncbi:MAG: WYL domain-containing protein [Olsenella sp.]|jgi:predicted DNA-binding transcriptional regulator YafY|nr:WYL domain-containing protein [Olsenella sp.]
MANRRQGAGRKGGLQEARELVAIVSSLDHAGDSLDVSAIAGRLGISEQDARHRMDLILSATGEGASVLPLMADETNGRLVLEGKPGVHAKKLRLTKSESVAVQAALARMGIPVDSPLYKKLAGSLSPSSPSDSQVSRTLGTAVNLDSQPETGNAAAATKVAHAILQCSRAIAQLGMLNFSYRGTADEAPRERHVDPKGLRNSDGAWYLDAFDPSRHGNRVFRLDRMTDVRISPAEVIAPDPIAEVGRRMVRITFRDRHYLDLLDWPGLRIERDDGSVIIARIPYYGGEWLPRHIAACAGTAHTSDGEVNSLAVAYAKHKLEERELGHRR